MITSVSCLPCRAYLKARGSRIQRELLRRSQNQAGYSATAGAMRFLRGLHQRHEDGLPLSFPGSEPAPEVGVLSIRIDTTTGEVSTPLGTRAFARKGAR